MRLGFAFLLLCLCSCYSKPRLPGFGGGRPDPHISEAREKNAEMFGVKGQIVILKYKLEEQASKQSCEFCGMPTKMSATYLSVNGNEIFRYRDIPLCREGCVQRWVSNTLGFKIDKCVFEK